MCEHASSDDRTTSYPSFLPSLYGPIWERALKSTPPVTDGIVRPPAGRTRSVDPATANNNGVSVDLHCTTDHPPPQYLAPRTTLAERSQSDPKQVEACTGQGSRGEPRRKRVGWKT